MTSIPPRPIRLLLLVVLALAVSATAALGAPTNGQIRAKRAEAQAAREQIAQLGEELEPAIERWNQAQAELADVQADIALNEQRITLVRGNLQASRDILAAKLVQDYKYGDTDTLAAILSSGSIGGMLDAADLLERSQTQVAELLGDLRADQNELAKREESLKKSVARAAELEATAQAEKERIDTALAQQKELEAGLEDEIAQLEQEELERQRRIAAEAARLLEVQRRLMEQAAQANPAPTIGGAAPTIGGSSGGTSGGSSGGSSGGGSTENIPAPPPTDGSLGARAVAVAMQYLGVPYVWGGASPGGFDCSGLVLYAYAQVASGCRTSRARSGTAGGACRSPS